MPKVMIKKKRKSRVPKKLLTFEASEPWRDWMSNLQEFLGMPRSVIIDRAVRELANREGFPEKPPRR